jgi:hypothetical protein
VVAGYYLIFLLTLTFHETIDVFNVMQADDDPTLVLYKPDSKYFNTSYKPDPKFSLLYLLLYKPDSTCFNLTILKFFSIIIETLLSQVIINTRIPYKQTN